MDNFTIRCSSENIYSYLRQEYNVPWTTSQSDVPVKIYRIVAKIKDRVRYILSNTNFILIKLMINININH